MFSSIGWPEVLLLAVLGLIIFGPDKLPKAASDGAKMLRQLRAMARNAADDLKAELGPELADLDIRSLHPRRFVEDAIFGDDEPKATAADGAATSVRPGVLALAEGERPPYDADAT
jgi:sec-independent protein translocase protein TatB